MWDFRIWSLIARNEQKYMDQPSFFHKSVLVEEVIAYLNPQSHKIYIDATFGSGGHTRAILEKEPTCRVIGIDWDQRSLDRYAPLITEQFGDRFIPVWGNFALLYRLMKKIDVQKVDGILADFGTSQMQIAEQPGFSLYSDAPLDMRMSASHHKTTAEELLRTASEDKLFQIFSELGEERFSRKIARAIVKERGRNRFRTTKQLAHFIASLVPYKREAKIHPATRVFQALRIYVNQELDNIRSFLKGGISLLAPHGRFVCISFHSLEDRLVKQFFIDEALAGKLDILTKRVVIPSKEEILSNPSSRSAKLRAAVKI